MTANPLSRRCPAFLVCSLTGPSDHSPGSGPAFILSSALRTALPRLVVSRKGGVFGVKENATTQYLKLELPLCLLGKGRELIGHRSRETKHKLISPKVFGSAGSGDRHTFRNQRVWGWPAFHAEPWPPAGSLLFLSGSEKHSH